MSDPIGLCYATCGASKRDCDLLLLFTAGNVGYYSAVVIFGGGPYDDAQNAACGCE
ncbi:hypothetical protein [Solemya elarraichensis gill symbiont]|uniref:hypothetical protein n=1 Tax=Solemya elarraichensis gill symbiont TaxID=1918949 RepID=UPI0014288AE2|nr:hypothetical protein [Solemya elarraichensis gill symbiont]